MTVTELLESVRRVEVRTNRLVNDTMVGAYLSHFKGRRHILRIVRELLMYQPRRRGTDISQALGFLNHVLHRRAIVFLLTDFLHGNGTAVAVPARSGPPAAPGQGPAIQTRDVITELGLTNIRHDVVCLHLHDPRESELPDAGLVTIEDAETGELLELDSGRRSVRERFADTNAARLAELDLALNRTGVDTLRLKTTEPFAPVLQRFFEMRRGRRRG